MWFLNVPHIAPPVTAFKALLWRLFASVTAGTAVTGSSPFADVADSAYYAGAVKWAVAEGITSGTTASTFSPDAPCTRAQIVTFLYRAEA